MIFSFIKNTRLQTMCAIPFSKDKAGKVPEKILIFDERTKSGYLINASKKPERLL